MVFQGVIGRELVTPLTRGMSTARWVAEVPVETVSIADLWVSQEGVHFEALLNPTAPVGGDPFPHVVQVGRKLVIEDGHTRITRAALSGSKTIEARVLRQTRW